MFGIIALLVLCHQSKMWRQWWTICLIIAHLWLLRISIIYHHVPDTQHRDIKHCFLVLSRDFSQYGSCAGSFYQEQKMANIGEFKIVSSEIPWKKMLKLALSLFLADLVVGNPTTKWRKRFFSTRRVWAKLFETVSNQRKNSFLKSNNQNLDFKGCVGKVPRF